jgi:hypothetical protein
MALPRFYNQRYMWSVMRRFVPATRGVTNHGGSITE